MSHIKESTYNKWMEYINTDKKSIDLLRHTVWKFSKSDAILMSLRFLTNITSEFENLYFISLNDYFGHKYDDSLFINQNNKFQCTLTLNY